MLEVFPSVRTQIPELTMSRQILEEDKIHPSIREKLASHQRDIVEEVQRAVRDARVLVVGMAQNPFPRKVRKLLEGVGIPYKYLEYGSYLTEWRRRNALKMWTGWPTFPMVFVDGVLVGGFDDVQRLVETGELKALLDG